MDTAVHPRTGEPVNVVEITALDPSIRHAVARMYVCTECQQMCHYRSKTKDGKSPTLYCRPHLPGCKKASNLEIEDSDDEIVTEVDKIENSGEILVLDPVPAESRRPSKAAGDGDPDGPGGSDGSRRRHADSGRVRKTDKRHKNIEQLLIDLDNRAFDPKKFTFRVNVPGQITLPVGRMIVPLADVDETYENEYRVYWGYIANVRSPDGRSFLNAGTFGTVGIMLTKRQREEIVERLRIEDISDVERFAVLVRGKYNVTNGKPFITFNDSADVAIIKSIKTDDEVLRETARQDIQPWIRSIAESL